MFKSSGIHFPTSVRAVYTHKDGAVHKAFVTKTAGLNSYKDWNFTDIQPPQRLANAGFFFSGSGDRVICLYCGLCLHKWQQVDNP